MKKATSDLEEFVKNLLKTNGSAQKASDKFNELLGSLLVPGSYYVRPDPDHPKRAFFGKILTSREPELSKVDVHNLVEDKKLRPAKEFSSKDINGKVVINNVENMIPISLELFEYAKSKAWNITSSDALQFVLLLARAESGIIPEGVA